MQFTFFISHEKVNKKKTKTNRKTFHKIKNIIVGY